MPTMRGRDSRRRLSVLVLVLATAASACREDPPAQTYDLEALRDPATCAECHPKHYREWLGSMHAYAGEDPVFRAMNQKGQRETEGELGDFCVSCHAPVALALGLTEDGLNLDQLPRETQGVTCWFCHQVEAIEGSHNNPLALGMDAIMRGNLSDAIAPDAHAVAARPHFDRNRPDSADMCGSCHDIVSPAGAHIERGYAEWQESFYADGDPDHPENLALWGLSCNDCHMRRSRDAIAVYPGVPTDRDRHDHAFVGVDVAITDFPDGELGPQLRAEQLAAIEDQRKTALCASLCVREVDGSVEVTVWLHDEGAGHSWPSAATPDRRAWVELVAVDAGDAAIYSSGVVADDQPIANARINHPTNWHLSTNRANSVVLALNKSGIKDQRLGAAGYSENQPVVPNADSHSRQRNRRVEIFVLAPDALIAGWDPSNVR